MRIGIIVERRYLRQEMPSAVFQALRTRSVNVDCLCPEGGLFDAGRGILQIECDGSMDLNRYDLVVCRTRSSLGLVMLSFADAAGILAINSHASTQRVRNKAEMAVALGRAGIACPPTMLADRPSSLAELPEVWFPLILKATFGDNSQGLRLVRCPEDLRDLHWAGDLVVAQRYVPNRGLDLKLYVCGQRVFAMRKPSPFNGDPGARPEPVEVDASMVDLALRCGRAFGLELYGVDTLETPEGLAVIEVNEFPNYTGVPGAAELIADFLLARAGSATQGPPELMQVPPRVDGGNGSSRERSRTDADRVPPGRRR